jgi:ATP-binding cassette subfamily B protein
VTSLSDLAWPVARAPEALDALARAAHLLPASAPPVEGVLRSDLSRAVGDAAAALGLVADEIPLAAGALEEALARSAPVLLKPADDPRLVALLKATRQDAVVLTPEGRRRLISRSELRALLTNDEDSPDDPPLSGVLEDAGFAGAQAERVAAALRRERASDRPWGRAFALAPSAALSLRAALVRRRLPRAAAVALAAAAAEAAVLAAAWWVLGRAALSGDLSAGWLAAFFLLLFTTVPLQAWGRLAQGGLAITFGGALRARLHAGALKLPPEEARREGSGRVLGRMFESARLEFFGLGAAFSALAALIQLPFALWVLSRGAAPAAGPLLLAAATLAVGFATATAFGRLRAWSLLRTEHTHGLVELMLGHRTRLAQGPPQADADTELARLLAAARAADGAVLPLVAVVPRAFLVAGVLAQGLAALSAPPLGVLAVGIGGVLLGHGALQVLCLGARDVCVAVLAWRQVDALSRAAQQRTPASSAALPRLAAAAEHAPTVIDARGVGFRYPQRTAAALAHVDLVLRAGERVLLEGPSGAGKSTLAALLGGLRRPTEGALLLRGLDHRTWGDAQWKRQVALAPQFQENHVFVAPLAFNLLMGRRWPPSPGDLREADEVCRELGLGALLDRMPAGLMQPVGDTGWQLSHGERARVFLARALLQDAELVVLDETFAALDPATLRDALACARRRAPTLLVVAHP